MIKKIMFQVVSLGIVSMFFFNSCNSRQKQGEDYPDEVETIETDLSDCYGKIKDLSAKMQEEGSAFWKQMDLKVRYHDEVMSVYEAYPNAASALTEALNNGMNIDRYLSAIVQNDNVIANLQHIDGECNQVERECLDGIEELRNEDECIQPSFRTTWTSVLERITNYSSKIREQVQIIRDAQ